MKHCSIVVVLIIAAITSLSVVQTYASSIGVYFNQDGTDCDATVTAPTPVQWYIVAHLGGDAAAAGITGAHLRLAGVPAGWFVNASPNPAANVSICPCIPEQSDLFLTFPSCQPGPVVLLFTVNGFASAPAGTTCLTIEAPTQPPLAAPILRLCDAPTFTALPVLGTSAVVNGDCSTHSCALAVEQKTWSRVKQIYQD